MAPGDVVDDVDGIYACPSPFLRRRQILMFRLCAVSMDDQDDADMEQRLVNEGMLYLPLKTLPIVSLIVHVSRVQDVEEEQPVPL